MGEKVRAKFKCISERKFEGWGSGPGPKPFFYDYEFTAVSGGSEEDKKFHAATPAGSIKLCAIVSGLFVPGKSYYLDFEEAGE